VVLEGKEELLGLSIREEARVQVKGILTRKLSKALAAPGG